jgi:hypothetical protein
MNAPLRIVAIVALSVGCRPTPLRIEIPHEASTQSVLFAVEGTSALQVYALASDAPGPLALGTLKEGATISVIALEYRMPLSDLGLQPGPIPPAACRPLPIADRIERGPIDGPATPDWTMLDALPPELTSFRIGCCPEGRQDDGTGVCSDRGVCANMFHDGGDGTCVSTSTCVRGADLGCDGMCRTSGCDPGCHDGGGGVCVARDRCAALYHLDCDGTCRATGCLAGCHDGGDGSCVATGTCGRGFHDDGTGGCVSTGCATGFKDGGGAKCLPSCSANGGAQPCLGVRECIPGYRDDGAGGCVGTSSTCAHGFHESGTGTCLRTGACAKGFADGGDGACVPFATCSAGYAYAGKGICLPVSSCVAPMHDGGDGACVATSTCSPGFLTDGSGTCHRWRRLGRLLQGRVGLESLALSTGDVLILGGQDGHGHQFRNVERIDSSGSAVSDSTLMFARWGARVAELPDGSVLVAGAPNVGCDQAPQLLSVEIRDPATRTFDQGPSLLSVHGWGSGLTVLDDGRILLAAGYTCTEACVVADTEIFDPVTFAWTSTSPLPHGRVGGVLVRLFDGRALMIAGEVADPVSGTGGSCTTINDDPGRVFDPATGRWSAAGAEIQRPRPKAVRLMDGRVLVTGGGDPGIIDQTTDVEIFDPDTNTFELGPPLSSPRMGETLTLLRDGRVLIAGGYEGNTAVAIAEIYDPLTNTIVAAQPMNDARADAGASRISSGAVIVSGGGVSTAPVPPSDSIEIFEGALRRP